MYFHTFICGFLLPLLPLSYETKNMLQESRSYLNVVLYLNVNPSLPSGAVEPYQFVALRSIELLTCLRNVASMCGGIYRKQKKNHFQ